MKIRLSKKGRRRILINTLLILISTFIGLGIGESAIRLQEGFPLSQLELPAILDRVPYLLNSKILNHGKQIWEDAHTDVPFEWLSTNPDTFSHPGTTAALFNYYQRVRTDSTDPYVNFIAEEAQKQWNAYFLASSICADKPFYDWEDFQDFPDELHAFVPPTPSMYPRFRYFRGQLFPKSRAYFNNFGWRGYDISLQKPDSVIRIAFVGASTTQQDRLSPHSYPEYVGHWLNLWAKAQELPLSFEIINAGREGLGSRDFSAIVQEELIPVRPDMIVYYAGANEFNFDDVEGDARRYQNAFVTWGAKYSALFRRLISISGIRFSNPGDPSDMPFPSGVDEMNPDINSPSLPVSLPRIFPEVKKIKNAIESIEGELIMCSFIQMMKDDMRLNPISDQGIYQYWNEQEKYAKCSYSYIRRMVEFQNRTLEKYAKVNELAFLDVAENFPLDPDLFLDGVHLYQNAIRLRAWAVFLRLVPILEQRIAAGKLPKSNPSPYATHPTFEQTKEVIAYSRCDCKARIDTTSSRCIDAYKLEVSSL